MGWRIYTFFIFTFLIILPTLMSPSPVKVSGPVSNDNIQNCVQNNYSSVDFLEVSNLYDFLDDLFRKGNLIYPHFILFIT